MLELYFRYRRVIERFRRDALGNEIDQIAADLSRTGYKHDSAKLYLARIARFSAFATSCGCSKSVPISSKIVDRYLRSRPTTIARWAAQAAIGHAARCFPGRFETRPRPEDPDRSLLDVYLRHLRVIRGLRPKTCEGLILTARRMLAWCRKHLRGTSLSGLTAEHVLTMTHDMLSTCRSKAARSSTTAYMRSFLRYLHWESLNRRDLSSFVQKTPCWRHAHLPPRVDWEDVRRAIDAIDTTTAVGMRDRAMMLLLASIGLRSRELRELELSDIRWKSGELLLRNTKGHRDRVVPLLDEVGSAVAEYVLRARPRNTERRVFLIHAPPVRPFRYSSTVARIILIRLQDAGVSIERGGAHLLRHSLATRLVEQRRPIKEVADLLGHRNIDATSLYVKVAVPQLVDVALPFPGGE
jgi:site-specific recombinase XerD